MADALEAWVRAYAGELTKKPRQVMTLHALHGLTAVLVR